MKKTILLSCVMSLLAVNTVLAQTEPVKTGNEWQMPKDVLIRSKTFSEGLKSSLGLDDATTKKVFDAYLGNTKTVDEIRMGSGSEKEKKDALATNQVQFDDILKGILPADKFKKYLSQKKK